MPLKRCGVLSALYLHFQFVPDAEVRLAVGCGTLCVAQLALVRQVQRVDPSGGA
jgi:hypothetical protein